MAATDRWDDIFIAIEGPQSAGVADLIAASDAFSADLYPPESNHGIDLRALAAATVSLFVARRGGAAIGCVALARRPDGEAEVKRLFVAEEARGLRLGERLMAAMEKRAVEGGVRVLRLETGIHNHAALKLYRSLGYCETGPFGSYRPDPLSVFMQKDLDRTGADVFIS